MYPIGVQQLLEFMCANVQCALFNKFAVCHLFCQTYSTACFRLFLKRTLIFGPTANCRHRSSENEKKMISCVNILKTSNDISVVSFLRERILVEFQLQNKTKKTSWIFEMNETTNKNHTKCVWIVKYKTLASRWFQSLIWSKTNKIQTNKINHVHIFSALQIISRVIKWYLFMVLSCTFTQAHRYTGSYRHILIEMSEWMSQWTTDNISICRFLFLSPR